MITVHGSPKVSERYPELHSPHLPEEADRFGKNVPTLENRWCTSRQNPTCLISIKSASYLSVTKHAIKV